MLPLLLCWRTGGLCPAVSLCKLTLQGPLLPLARVVDQELGDFAERAAFLAVVDDQARPALLRLSRAFLDHLAGELVQIEREGDEIRIRPARRSLAGVLAKFGQFSPGFMAEGRGDQEQAERNAL